MIILIFLNLLPLIFASETTMVETTTAVESTETPATVSTLPGEEIYTATFPSSLPIYGTITFSESPTSAGVKITLSLDSALGTGGHKYHLHNNPTLGSFGSTGTCSSAGGHYDPTLKDGPDYNGCGAIKTECYRGDLSGKYANIGFTISSSLREDWIDETLSLEEVMGKSVVIHQPNESSDFLQCASVLGEGDAMSQGGDNLPGGVNFEAAEASSGTVFLMVVIYIIGFTFGIFAIFKISTTPIEADNDFKKKMKQWGSKMGLLDADDVGGDEEDDTYEGPPPSNGTNPFKYKKSVDPPPKRSFEPAPSIASAYSRPPITRPLPPKPQEKRSPAAPPRGPPPPQRGPPPQAPPQTSPFMNNVNQPIEVGRDVAPSMASSIGVAGLPPIPSYAPDRPPSSVIQPIEARGAALDDAYANVDVQIVDNEHY